jgi:acyl carrier protein
MTKEQIIATTNHFLIEEFEVASEVITPDANLKDTLDLDSLDYVDLVVIIESNFGIKLDSKDFATIETFQHLYHLIDTKLHAVA